MRITDLTVNSNFGFHFVYDRTWMQNRTFVDVLSWLRDCAEDTPQQCQAMLEDKALCWRPR